MNERLPVVSGAQLIAALGKVGWELVRQRGSHVRLKHPDRALALVVPLHHELKRGTLAAILREAGLSREDLRRRCEGRSEQDALRKALEQSKISWARKSSARF